MDATDTHRLGLEAWSSGKGSHARALLRQALRESGSVELLNDLAVVLTATGETAAARALLQTARYVDACDAEVATNLEQLRVVELSRRRLHAVPATPGPSGGVANENPRFSIVLPTRNRRNWLPRAIASVLEQTYGDWQLVVLDNGTDRVEDLLPDDPRVVYRWEPATGVTDALNRGFAHATGELGLALADDDRLPPEALASYHAAIGTGDWVVATTYIHDLDGIVLHVRGGSQENVDRTRAGDMMLGGAVCYRLDLFRRVGGFDSDPEIETAVDFDLYVRLLDAADPVVIPDVALLFTDHPDGLSRQRADEQQQAAAKIAATR